MWFPQVPRVRLLSHPLVLGMISPSARCIVTSLVLDGDCGYRQKKKSCSNGCQEEDNESQRQQPRAGAATQAFVSVKTLMAGAHQDWLYQWQSESRRSLFLWVYFQPQNMANSGESDIVAPMQLLGLACLDPPLWLPLVAEFFPLRHLPRFSSLHFTPSEVINISVANFPLRLTWVGSTKRVMICSNCGSAPRQARPKNACSESTVHIVANVWSRSSFYTQLFP